MPSDSAFESHAPLAPRALYEQVADRLRAKIFARELEPGAWIDEMQLASDFGISRTPLREALKVLATEGLVTMKVRRGAYVTEMSRDDIRQVYHLLALIESDAAGSVARAAGDEQRRELAALHEALEQALDDRDRFFALNERFHLRLLEFAGNRWALATATDLRKVMKLNRHHSLFRQGRIADSLAEHRALMQAIEVRNAPEAVLQMQRHFANGLSAATG